MLIHRSACAFAFVGIASAQVEVRVLSGDAGGDRFGSSIATLGDLDGDGRADFAAGAPRHDGGGADAGQVEVFSGAGQSVLWSAVGSSANEYFGTSLANAGDIDHDGRADLIVGAPHANGGHGAVRVYSGGTGAVLHDIAGTTSGTPFWTNVDFGFGFSVAGGMDVDLDGAPDLLVGAPEGNGRTRAPSRCSAERAARG